MPVESGKIQMYTCGPTVYATAHIGNFRTFMFEDLLKRYLLYKGYRVEHVMNITDVDDKTIAQAIKEGITLSELTAKHTAQFEQDLAALNILPADHLPRATEFVPHMIDSIQELIGGGHAYESQGSVFFSVGTFPDYGKLSRLDPDQLEVSERVAEDDYGKHEQWDFALWKAYKPADGDNRWDSPWGPGRPGWHIECSVMAGHFLRTPLDIHCGGVDNIFPHHENEIAQSECLYWVPFVNNWLHSEHLLIDGQKMAKSRGNYYTLQDLLDLGLGVEAIRYTLLSTHYRHRLNFTIERVIESQGAIHRLRELARRLEMVPIDHTGSSPPPPDYEVTEALDNDLNISMALGAIFHWAHTLFTHMDRETLDGKCAADSLVALHRYDELLGVIFSKPLVANDEIIRLIAQRIAAREIKDWSKADEIREKLLKKGILLEDTPTGTIWKRGVQT